MLVNHYQRKNNMQEKPDTISTSPVPRVARVLTMSFQEAIALIIGGDKVTRVEWDNDKEYGFLKDEFLSIHTKGKDHQWLVSKADMEAGDWVVVR